MPQNWKLKEVLDYMIEFESKDILYKCRLIDEQENCKEVYINSILLSHMQKER